VANTATRTKSVSPRALLLIGSLTLFSLVGLLTTPARAGDDTARFSGTWQAQIPFNGQTVTVISIHEGNGYRNFLHQATGDVPAGEGTFTAANGKYHTSAPFPDNGGVYYFLGNDTAVCTNFAGRVATWKRIASSAQRRQPDANSIAHDTTAYVPPSTRPGNSVDNPNPPSPMTQQPAAGTVTRDATGSDAPSSPEVLAGLAAMNRKDFNTAWREFMAAAQKGDSDGEFGIGGMLYNHVNPPGTGFWAQCEKWLLQSANQGNPKGMEFLGRFYFDNGRNIAGGINPMINNAPIPPALQAQAEVKFKQSREWFQRAAEKGDQYAMGNLAMMLDSGVGGPRDPQGAAQWRERTKAGPDQAFARKATADPAKLAMDAAWQSGHYADAIQNAQVGAEKGNASSEELLGRAYYEGVGVPRNYSTALFWLNKSVAQGNADAMFILGLMYEHARGVNQDIPKAMGLFDRAAEKGQRYAEMEAAGMRMQGEANRQAAEARARGGGVEGTACAAAGGVYSPGECMKGGGTIDPFNAEQAAGSGY
jgi:TPR repeat protein